MPRSSPPRPASTQTRRNPARPINRPGSASEAKTPTPPTSHSAATIDVGDIVGFTEHDHSACIADALGIARSLCARRKQRLTPVRQRVFEILLESHSALGAYEVLARLDAEGLGSKPPVAYRALGFLLDNGLIHRIEKLNAFVACAHPGAQHSPVFMLCRECGSVAESTHRSPERLLGHSARQTGFVVENAVVEAEGVCPSCLPPARTTRHD